LFQLALAQSTFRWRFKRTYFETCKLCLCTE